MKLKSVLLLAVALSCGLVAMLGVQQILSGGKDESPDDDVTKLLVATEEIAPGHRLTEKNVTFKLWPKDSVPQGALTSIEEYKDMALKVRAYPGEVIMKAKLGKGIGASADIPLGMRVITVAVDQTMSHSGLLLPGNRVDVLVTYDEQLPDRGRVPVVKTVLQYTEVFATDNFRDAAGAETKENNVKNVSLLVTPEEANVLKLAEDRGKIHIVLRADEEGAQQGIANVDDWLYRPQNKEVAGSEGSKGDTREQNVQTFLDQQQPAQQPAPEPVKQKWLIEIYRGETRTVQEVDLPAEPFADASATANSTRSVRSGSSSSALLDRFMGLIGGQGNDNDRKGPSTTPGEAKLKPPATAGAALAP